MGTFYDRKPIVSITKTHSTSPFLMHDYFSGKVIADCDENEKIIYADIGKYTSLAFCDDNDKKILEK